jgi:hypothetical protein
MSAAIDQIVRSYVKLGNRVALEKMRDHRRRLLQEARIRADSGYNPEVSMSALQQDIEAIEGDLSRLE